MPALQWKVDNRGAHVAHGLVRTYEVFYQRDTFDAAGSGNYYVRVDGYPIGSAPTEDAGKMIAQAHNDR